MGIGDGGSTSPDDAQTTTVGQWEHLQARNTGSPVNEFILYSVSNEGASYYVDDAWVVNANAVPTQPVRYYHPDRLGTRLITTAETQEVIELLTLPYGATLQGEAAAAGAPSFTSYDRSQLTGLDYAINRHYDPQLGRFLQPDPLGLGVLQISRPQSNNAYTYCGDDPINYIDPRGLDICIEGYCFPEGTLIADEIFVYPSIPPRAGDSPDEAAREALAEERRARGEAGGGRGRGGGGGGGGSGGVSVVGAMALSQNALNRIIYALMRLLTQDPLTPPPPPPPTVEIEIEAAAAEAVESTGAGSGGALIFTIDPRTYRLPDVLRGILEGGRDPGVI